MASLNRSETTHIIRRKPIPSPLSSQYEYRSVPSIVGSVEQLAGTNGHTTLNVNDATDVPILPQQSSESSNEQRTSNQSTGPTHNTGAVSPGLHHPFPHHSLMWNPLVLHSGSLVGFASLFLALLAATLILYHYSEANHGISNQKPSNRYIWKYGPMAVIVLVTGMWHQVDYYCRVLAPWQSLSRGPKPTTQTMLLDYISPLDPITCFHAMRNRHWAVAASAGGALLLDLALVFSTALLVLLPVLHTQVDGNISVDSKFSNARFELGDSAPGMTLWGIFEHGLGPPFGTTDDLAFATPALDGNYLESEIIVADVPVFLPNLTCEPAPVDVKISHNSVDSSQLILEVTVSTSTCELFTDDIDGGHMLDEVMPLRVLTASGADQSLCGGQENDNYFPWSFVVTDMRYWQTFGSSRDGSLNVTGWSAQLANATAIVCQPSYTLQNAAVSVEVSSRKVLNVQLLNEQSPLPPIQIEGFNNSEFSLGMALGLEPLSGQFQPRWATLDLTRQDGDTALFALMSMLNDTYSLETFLDPAPMMSAATAVFNGVAVQMAHHGLSLTSNSSVSGTIQYVEHRVIVRLLSTIVLCAAFGLLALLSLCILVFRARDVVSRPPNSIISHAAILSASAKILVQLKDLGSSSDQDLSHCMYGRNYESVTDHSPRNHSFCIEEMHNEETQVPISRTVKKWWYPFAARTEFVVLIAILVIGVIAGLEIIRRLSKPEAGFYQLHISQTAAATWSTIVPTAIMVLIKLLFKSQGFAILVFSPFTALMKVKASARQAVMKNMVGQIPIINMWRSLKGGQPAVFLISTVLLLSSFPTIIISGLYSVQEFGSSNSPTVQTLDFFDTDWNTTEPDGTKFDNQAGHVFTLLDWYNLSYPALTYDELVFPSIAISNPPDLMENSSTTNGTRLQVAIPAARAALNCSFAIPGRATSVWAQDAPGPGSYDSMVQGNQIEVPDICSLTSKPRVVDITTNRPAEIFEKQGEYFSAPNEYPWSYNTSGYPGVCPTFGFTFGFTGRDSNSTRNISSLTCYQMMEEVDTVTTFLWPSLKVDPTAPPVINESSARVLAPHTNYQLNAIIANEFGTLQYAPLEPLFLHIINGTEGVPAEQLVGPENQDRLLDAVQHTYRKYMAQAINLNMRKPVVKSSGSLLRREANTSKSYPATFINLNSLCLVQNNAPKIALQVVLAVMLGCGLVAYLLTPMRRTLPHDPLTIAGTMSLLASGALGRKHAEGGVMPEGAEFMEDSELQKALDKCGSVLRMGWWSSDGAVLKSGEEEKKKKSKNAKKVATHGLEDKIEASGKYFGIGLLESAPNRNRVDGREGEEDGARGSARLIAPDQDQDSIQG